jgi:hypothetical protein
MANTIPARDGPIPAHPNYNVEGKPAVGASEYECLLLADCCGAVNDGPHTWAIESVKIEKGVFGAVASAQAFIDAFPHEGDIDVQIEPKLSTAA